MSEIEPILVLWRAATGVAADAPARRGRFARRMRQTDPIVRLGRAQQPREKLLVLAQVKLETTGISVVRVRRSAIEETALGVEGGPAMLVPAVALAAESGTLFVSAAALPPRAAVCVALTDVVGDYEAAFALSTGKELLLISNKPADCQFLVVFLTT